MAESASAAPSGPGAKGAWWKSLTTSRKKPKEALAAAAAAPATSWPPRQPAEPSELLPTPPSPSDLRENQQPNAGSRRNLKISRSGRFKEKRKVRATLLAAETSPQQLFEGGGAVTGTAPAHPSEETPCQ